jgi:hypothetical protein
VSNIACQNSPAILTEPAYHRALLTDGAPRRKAARRWRLLLPILSACRKIAAQVSVPVSAYLPWKDPMAHLADPDFDRWYPLLPVMSLVTTRRRHPSTP